MRTSYWLGFNLKDFLIPGFDIESPIGLTTICLGIIVLVCVFESLKTTKIIKKLRANTVDNRSLFRLAFSRSTEKSNLIERQNNAREIWSVLDIFLHFIELLLGYLLMLMVMTFNGYIMISIAIGAGLAYMMFGTAMMNIMAQIVIQKMCTLCQIKSDGDSTPVTESMNEGTSTSASTQNVVDLVNEETYTTVQIH